MDTVDRSRRVAIAAVRDASGRARALAEGLEALARALDTMVVEFPNSAAHVSSGRQPVAEEELWTAADVARFLKTNKSWVYQATATGSVPSIRVGHLRRFEPARVRMWANGDASEAGNP